MVAIAPRDADAFLERDSDELVVFLFHGADSGLVKERARAAVRKKTPDLTDPFAVARLNSDILSADPSRLVDEAKTVGLWSTERSIWIDGGAAATLPGLELVLQDDCPGVRIVIEAGELRRDAPLRRLCEQSSRAAAIECPLDAPGDTARLIDECLAQAGLQINDEAKTTLVGLLTSDRLSSRSELEKLVTYSHGKSSVSLTDIEETISGGAAVGPDMVFKAALTGDFATLTAAWSRAKAVGLDGATLAGFALRRLLLFHSGAFREPIGLSPPAVRLALRGLADAVRAGRREPRLAESLAMRALWSMARSARRRSG